MNTSYSTPRFDLASRLLSTDSPGPAPVPQLITRALQMQRSARTAAVPRLLQSSSKAGVPIVKATTVPNAGIGGVGVELPGEPGGPIEPDLLDQNPPPPPGGSSPIQGMTQGGRIPLWGGRGPWAVQSGKIDVNAGEHDNPFTGETVMALPGETWLGGGFVGTDPNTGKPIYDPLGSGSFSGGQSYAGAGANGFGGLGSGFGGPAGGFGYGIGGQGFGGVGNNSSGVNVGGGNLPGRDRDKFRSKT